MRRLIREARIWKTVLGAVLRAELEPFNRWLQEYPITDIEVEPTPEQRKEWRRTLNALFVHRSRRG